MALLPFPPAGWIKRVLPRSLLGRSLLMILIPLILLQAVALQIYYGSHLDLVYRRLSGGISGEIAFTLELLSRQDDAKARTSIIDMAFREFDLRMRLEPGAVIASGARYPNVIGPMDDELYAALRERLNLPFTMDWAYDQQSVRIRVQLPDGVLDVLAPRKRVDLGTIYLFVAWMAGTALLVFGIAALFMRNQVRAIRRLAMAVDAFGVGRDTGPIKPEGAVEVRQAATAFNRMQERIRRFLAQRTEMLAGVSHDLRTPLTRLRLALAMVPRREELRQDLTGMTADVEEMERMIEG
ncbi:MAG: HAMP domain-containing protein, partial [Pseudomonadota bacterium]|nr:HAMP domain-containing protein [Pseudomonadota bacterium]